MNKHKIFIIGMIIASVILFGLGSWQIKRLEEKTNRIARLEENRKLPPISFPEESGICVEEFQKLRITGKYLYDQEILVTKYRKKEVGYHVVTPMLISDDSIIMVNRGWAPLSMEISRPSGRLTIETMVRVGDKVRWYSPSNKPEKDKWFLADVKDMVKFLRAKNDREVRHLFVQVTKEANPQKYPAKLATTFKVRNDHLQYAFIWFSLSLAALVMAILYARSELQLSKKRKA
jgi:surfeit locus 1 family protein